MRVTAPRPIAERLRHVVDGLVAALEGPAGPRLGWTLRGYRAAWLGGDVTAGLALAALIVPLSIGYAGVAGLPPEMGLYASIAPLLAYAVLGSSRPLVLGPDAASASMIAASIAPLAASQDDRVRLAGVLGLVVAGVFVAMRVARLGFLADLLSRPILVGYLAGVGVTVALGQIPKLLGGSALDAAMGVLGRVDWTTADLSAIASATVEAVRASGADLLSLAIGVAVVVGMLMGRRALPRIPMALVAMVLAVAASWALGLQGHGVKVLGPVPGGLPPVGVPTASLTELVALVPGAIGLALLTFADTAAAGKTFAARLGERTDPNRELAALAFADAAGVMTGGYAVSSSASRTAATLAAGSRTQLAGLVAAAAVLVVMLLLTAPLSYLPIPALGAVVLVSALGIVDLSAMRDIWRLKAGEGVVALTAMAGVMLYGTLAGVAVAVLLATLNIVRRAAAPPIVEVGRRDDGSWRDLRRWGDARRVDGVAVVRFAGPLFFASVTGLDARVRALVAERSGITAVVLDLGATSDVDITAAEALGQLADDLGRDGRRLVAARPLGHVLDALHAYGLERLLPVVGGEGAGVDGAIASLTTGDAGLAQAEADAEPFAVATTAAAGPAVIEAPGPHAGTPVIEGGRLVLRVVAALGGAVLAAGLLSFALGLAGIGSGPGIGPGPVPNLVGMSLSRATLAASDAGFTLSQPVQVPRDDLPEGTVIRQYPTAGAIVDRHDPIQPTVSSRRPLVSVPDVVGQTESQAIVTLTGAGFGVTRTATVTDPVVAVGHIVSTAPAAGTRLATGQTVGYVVSSGPAPTPTPEPAPSDPPSPSHGATATPAPLDPPSAPIGPSTAPSGLPSGEPSPGGSASPDPGASAPGSMGPGATPSPDPGAPSGSPSTAPLSSLPPGSPPPGSPPPAASPSP